MKIAIRETGKADLATIIEVIHSTFLGLQGEDVPALPVGLLHELTAYPFTQITDEYSSSVTGYVLFTHVFSGRIVCADVSQDAGHWQE